MGAKIQPFNNNRGSSALGPVRFAHVGKTEDKTVLQLVPTFNVP
jgi:hypothetical protein